MSETKKKEWNHLLIIGAPRSGSTWLFGMLATHPEISSFPFELTLYSRYFSPIITAFDLETEFTKNTGHITGLPAVASREEVFSVLQQITDKIYARSSHPERKWILDKHPFYSLEPEIISRVLPDVFVINLIRDGREVALSWMNTYQKAGFGARDIRQAANDWDRLTRSASKFKNLDNVNYIEIFYHDLVNKPEAELKKILTFTNIEDNGFIQSVVKGKANDYVSVPNEKISAEERKSGNTWKQRMRYEDRLIFNAIAGDQLIALGFERNNKWVGNPFVLFFVKLKIKYKILASKFINLSGR